MFGDLELLLEVDDVMGYIGWTVILDYLNFVIKFLQFKLHRSVYHCRLFHIEIYVKLLHSGVCFLVGFFLSLICPQGGFEERGFFHGHTGHMSKIQSTSLLFNLAHPTFILFCHVVIVTGLWLGLLEPGSGSAAWFLWSSVSC